MDDSADTTEGEPHIPLGTITKLSHNPPDGTTPNSTTTTASIYPRLSNVGEGAALPHNVVSLGVKIGGSDEDLDDNANFEREVREVRVGREGEGVEGGVCSTNAKSFLLKNSYIEGLLFQV